MFKSALAIPDMQAAAELLANGEMGELKGDSEFETTIYIKLSGQNPDSYDPRFLSSRSRSIAYDEPFSDK
ncbi:MAG: hypothetical protein AAGU27_12545 [Dehalobacterium sp.]